MARFARTQTNIQTNDGMSAVRTPSAFNHVQQQTAGALDGAQPFAGDLSNAFSNFFGQVQKAGQTLQEAEFYTEKVKAQEFAQTQKEGGFLLANKMTQKNPNITRTDAEAQLSEEQKNNSNFMSTFRRTLGSNLGDNVYANFKVHMANVPPANYEAEASKWWEKNYSGGTGDVTVDSAMQAQWVRNYESDRVQYAGQAIKGVREDTTNELIKSAGVALNKPDFGVADLATIQQGFKTVFGYETDGQNMARTLTALKSAAVPLGRTATQRFIATLHQPTTGPDGKQTTFAEQFPAQVQEIEAEAMRGLESHVTLTGQETLKNAQQDLATMLAQEPDELKQFELLTNWRNTNLPKLSNTPGLGAGYRQLESQVTTKIAELGAYKLGMNRMGAFVADPTGAMAGFDLTEYKKYAEEYMTRNFNPFTGKQGVPDEVVAQQAGAFLRAGVSRFGINAIPAEITGQFSSALMSQDPATAARAASALKMLDGNGQMGAMLLDKDPRALAKFMDMTQGASTTPYGTLADRARTYDSNTSETYAEIQKQGGIRKYLFSSEGTSTKIDAKWQSEFRGRKMNEALDEALGDSWGTPDVADPVYARVDSMVGVVVARRRAAGLPVDDFGDIRKEVALNLRNTIVVNEGKISMVRDEQTVGVDPKTGRETRVPLGNAVINPFTRTVENTAETLKKDRDAVSRGLRSLNMDGIVGVDIGFVQSTEARKVNGQLLVDKEHGVPMHIPVGQGLSMQQQFNNSGEEKSWLTRWGNDKVTFTGNLDADQKLAEKYLHPSLILMPQKGVKSVNGEYKEVTTGYQLILTPRLTEHLKMTDEQLRQAALQDPREVENAMAVLARRQRSNSWGFSPIGGFR